MGRRMLVGKNLNSQSAKTCDLSLVHWPSTLLVNNGAFGERGIQSFHCCRIRKLNQPFRHSGYRMKDSPPHFMRRRKGGEVVASISIIAPGHAAWPAPSHERLRLPIVPDLVESERHSEYPDVR